MKLKSISLAWSLLVLLIAVPATLSTEIDKSTQEPAKVREVAIHLSAFEEKAATVSRDADDLWSLSQNHRTNWQSHAYYLNNLRGDINSMGQLLAELEKMKPQASGAQQMAIENARPHLVALANETSKALDLVRAGRGNLTQTRYKETVADLSKQADTLYQTVDTIVDYHNADNRLDKLEASHSELDN